MRVKLHLSEKEMMESSWISLNLQMADFPYYRPYKKGEGKRITDPKKIEEIFGKFKKP